jgi:phosphatidylinositol alpha-mannosyltransferase
MRIAVVSPYAWTVPGGVNNHIKSLVVQLEARGHEVWVIAPAGTLIHRARTLPPGFISAGRSFPVRANGSQAYVNGSFFMLHKMRKILASHDFDLVHVHEPTIPAVGAAATMAAPIPVVGTFHAAGAATAYYGHWRPLAERILSSLTVRIAVSEAARECVGSQFPGVYRIIPNGIDVDRYASARGERKIRGRVLFIGRPDPRKGLEVLVSAFKQVRTRAPGASLVLVGPTDKELRTLMNRAHCGTAEAFRGITALGRVPFETKLEQMRQAEILCAPSLGGESFGIVLTEAMAAGLPVVASDIPGYRAVLAEGTVGTLVPPGDAEALEDALCSLLNNPQALDDFSFAGALHAERYSWDRVAERVLETYEEALYLGPRLVKEQPVPALRQLGHFVLSRPKSPRMAKPREVRGRTVG